MASQNNGCSVLIHEDDIEFLDENNKPVDLHEIKIEDLEKQK